MRARIQRWGNSLALRIPKSFAAEAGLADESLVDVRLIDGQLVIVPVAPAAYTLESLLAGVNDDNLHRETPTGPPAGDEVW
ncbi:AbrB/MazE/SpoVT family DNA-binding domain-containing protein [Oscillochloris sp. ZM17-4]|uniref:AbrB/MazE/SpoVT family DNA-binding domain-containing protein n=1 Tax=Oscillochloris sp. ZM17-4 TaxID=2866714 RepID=UPI001C72B4DA|nr:AbrB/MazE/SpoVT family DNA-binding domain-containing protein [Oscillochloris sp. ZM17-4]MBX0329789.1 AbrB/MazE/SpoVT family DNA-binding domain-containing protein [Oscillochloris sp. ZM17-4]